MLKRILVAVIFIPILVVIIFFAPPIALPIMVAAISAIAIHEILWSTGCVKYFRISAYSAVLGALIPFWFYFSSSPAQVFVALFIYVVLLFAEAIGSKKQVTLEKMGSAFFVSIMIPVFLSCFIRIMKLDHGQYYILLPFVAAFTSDAFALFAGLLFGKHKMAPNLSPKKTWEGAVGGLLGSMVCVLVYAAIVSLVWGAKANYLVFALYGLLGSVVSQFGDLSFSYIKREYGIKDYGNLLPGHGGVLDRFDSVMFCGPLTEIMLLLLPFFSEFAGA